MPFENLPYTNFHELNSDWMIERLNDLNQYVVQAQDYAEAAASSAEQAAQAIGSAGAQATQAGEYAQAAASSAGDAQQAAQQAADAAQDVQDSIEEIEQEIAALTGGVNPFAGHTLHAFGDSNMMTSYIDPKIYTKVKDALGMIAAYNHSENGAAFQVSNDTQIIEELNNQTTDPNCALVLCCGGINDLHYVVYDVAAFRSAVNEFIVAAKAKYPNAIICMMFDSGSQMPNRKVLNYERAFMDVCSGATNPGRVVCIPTADMPLNPALFYNTNHWSSDGIDVIVSRICSVLLGGAIRVMTGRNTHESFNASNPSPYGNHTGFVSNILTEIDPYQMKRTDHVKLMLTASFDSEADSFGYLCRIPACYQYGDSHLGATDDMRTFMFNLYKSTSGTLSTKQVPMYYEPFGGMDNVETVTPQLIIRFKYTTAKTDIRGWKGIATFDLITGYDPAA